MQKQYNSQPVYPGLDAVKLICSILVVYSHVLPVDVNNINLPDSLLRVAVPFFFVTSGFLLYRKENLKDFRFDRTVNYLKRLFLLYFLWTIIYLPWIVRDIFLEPDGVFIAFLKFGRNVIFTGSYPHLWYLPALMFAVLLISLLLSKGIKPTTILIFSSTFYLLGLLAQTWFGLILPLSEQAPLVWSYFQLFMKIILTTRNGLFEGFLFVAIGMYLAFYPSSMDRRRAIIGLVFSLLLLMLEFTFLKEHGKFLKIDMFLSLVPISYFLIIVALQLDIPKTINISLVRGLSSLIYFLHEWVIETYDILFSEEIWKTSWIFIAILASTILVSLVIIQLSRNTRFKFLKWLY